jgi:hypothetical protein
MTIAKKRSTFLIGIGACALVVSTGLAALATRDGGDNKPNVAATASTPTTVAAVGSVAAPAGVPSFTIPTGKQAIEVQVPAVAGLTGFVKAGDLVNVYGALSPVNGQPADPAGKLVLQKVKVLASQAAPDGASTTYVLAVDTADAEAIVYLTSFQKVYLTLARDDQGSLLPKGFSGRNA